MTCTHPSVTWPWVPGQTCLSTWLSTSPANGYWSTWLSDTWPPTPLNSAPPLTHSLLYEHLDNWTFRCIWACHPQWESSLRDGQGLLFMKLMACLTSKCKRKTICTKAQTWGKKGVTIYYRNSFKVQLEVRSSVQEDSFSPVRGVRDRLSRTAALLGIKKEFVAEIFFSCLLLHADDTLTSLWGASRLTIRRHWPHTRNS